eukprot:10215707-Lingulodinium_polyedra.AAC.1
MRCYGMTWVLTEHLHSCTTTRRSCAHCPPASARPIASRAWSGSPAHVQEVEVRARTTGNLSNARSTAG